MKVRAITIGVHPGVPFDSQVVRNAGRFAARVREACESRGLVVQTVRLTTPPVGLWLQDVPEAEIVRYVHRLQQYCHESEIDYCALGPVRSQRAEDRHLLRMLPRLIAETETVFASASLAEGPEPVSPDTAQATAEVIQAIAHRTPEGFGNLRFAAVVHCPPHIPFFPAAFHVGVPAFSLALEAADLVAAVCTPHLAALDLVTALQGELACQIGPVQEIAQGLTGQGFVFRGIDLSPAPGPGPEASIAYAIEQLGYGRFGEVGTLHAAALITSALKNTALSTCGYCGLMLPVLEDAGLAERNNQGLLRLSTLLTYSAVCGTGLDTIPVPGDVSVRQLTSLLLDVGMLGWKLKKPLSARLLPIPGKKAGDMTAFDFDYFVNTKIMPVE